VNSHYLQGKPERPPRNHKGLGKKNSELVKESEIEHADIALEKTCSIKLSAAA
jgi:hypothetical protein